MKPWLSYIKDHPLLSVTFAAVLSSIATAAAFRDDWLWGLACVYAALTGIVCFLVWRHSCVLCILCCVLVSSPGRAQELPPQSEPEVAEAGPILGGAVIVIGGTAAYLLWKFCQKHFPAAPPAPPPPPVPTNNPVNPTNTAPNTVGPTYALGIDIDLGSCPDQEDQEATTSYIAVTVGPGGSPTTSMSYGHAQSFSALQDTAAEHGLDITGHQQPPATTVNGEAGTSDVVTWLPDSRTVRVQRDGETAYRVSLEVSQDLRVWQPLARVECGEGFQVTFADAEDGSPWFYRVMSKMGD